ncbi:hypothetical protein ACXR8U_27350 [Methylobacterium radiotolerans]|uniref:hypothetical protein n=1 Tax=Methylobacterium TaxID=407 RepID=UPI0005E90C50|nr:MULTISPECIES: hypothetical protein [Methylobacterium]MBN6823979.1 hypothetical protein [Methylobacterium organophilum]OXE40541.1 hypothetical protein CCS92_18870 [Methylobacterium radiotolerans]GAN49844.1 putative diguanylate cyclase [Methylobacterium sp. ME121]
MSANDNRWPEFEDRTCAVDLARRMAEADERLRVAPRDMPTLQRRLEYVLRAFETDDLAVVCRAADGTPTGANLTGHGFDLAARLSRGDLALFPAMGRVKAVRHWNRCRLRTVRERSNDFGPPRDGPARVVATAPSHYRLADVEGSETVVLIDPIETWQSHPAQLSYGRKVATVRSAWEVFSIEGRSHGLLFETSNGYEGIDASGGHRAEDTLPGAVWQISVNY